MRNSLIFLLFLSLPGLMSAQKLDWFALNDCASHISVKFLEIDPDGNSYVVGQFQGETFFHSATSEGPGRHTYTNNSWKRTFLIKYDSLGNFQYLINMYGTSSNGNYADPRAFTRLSDGRLVLAAYTDNGIYIKDSQEEEQTVRGRKQMMLLFFSPEGQFLNSTPIDLYHILKVVEAQKGSLCLLGRKKSYLREFHSVFFLEAGEKELQQFALPDTPVIDIKVHRDKLWFLLAHQVKEKYKIGKLTLSLYEAFKPEPNQPIARHFTQTYENHKTYKSYIIEQPGKIEVVAQFVKDEKKAIVINGLPGDLFKNNGLFIYHRNGQLKTRLDLGNIQANLFNIQHRKAGGYMAEAYAREDIWIRKQKLIKVPTQPDYYWERLVIFFDPFLQLANYSATGSTSLQNNPCTPRELNGNLFIAAPLINFGYFAGEYKELNWKSGFYVSRISGLFD